MSWLKAGLRALEVNGLGALLLPMVALALLTRWEKRWWPEIEWRKKWARRIVFGSAILAVLLAWLGPTKTEATREVAPVKIDENAAAEMKPAQAPEEKPVTPRHRGPSGK